MTVFILKCLLCIFRFG